MRLALIGKNISHSKSKIVYEELLNKKIEYNLVDCKLESDIPSAKDLFLKYDGVSITSPYKKHFVDSAPVLIDKAFACLGAVNCLRSVNGKIEGINTDYLAVKEIISDLILKFGQLDVVILGNGIMSNITKMCLANLGVPIQVFYRGKHGDISTLDLSDKIFLSKERTPIVINCCSRDFVFRGKLPKNSIFWDHNYDMNSHALLVKQAIFYLDGMSLLKNQALHALSFWGF